LNLTPSTRLGVFKITVQIAEGVLREALMLPIVLRAPPIPFTPAADPVDDDCAAP